MSPSIHTTTPNATVETPTTVVVIVAAVVATSNIASNGIFDNYSNIVDERVPYFTNASVCPRTCEMDFLPYFQWGYGWEAINSTFTLEQVRFML
jgi:hypothetical protein